MSKLIVVAVVLLLVSCVSVQAQTPQHNHSTPAVDGSKNPEQIPDAEAQLHWLLVTASFPENLAAIGLSDVDKLTVISVIADFKAQFLQMIDVYNTQATEDEKRGRYGDLAAFQGQIDALAARTFQRLEFRLVPGSYTRITKQVLAQKSSMWRAQ